MLPGNLERLRTEFRNQEQGSVGNVRRLFDAKTAQGVFDTVQMAVNKLAPALATVIGSPYPISDESAALLAAIKRSFVELGEAINLSMFADELFSKEEILQYAHRASNASALSQRLMNAQKIDAYAPVLNEVDIAIGQLLLGHQAKFTKTAIVHLENAAELLQKVDIDLERLGSKLRF